MPTIYPEIYHGEKQTCGILSLTSLDRIRRLSSPVKVENSSVVSMAKFKYQREGKDVPKKTPSNGKAQRTHR